MSIFTIGYGSREIDAFLRVLQSYEIRYLVDVRSHPYSRYRPEFNQAALRAKLSEAGIKYLFMGEELGGQPEDRSCYRDGKVDYDVVKVQPFFQQGLGRLQKAFDQNLRVALMCSEGKPEMCHRSKLIGKSLLGQGIGVMHIDEQDELIGQEAVLLRLSNGQTNLFDDPFVALQSQYTEQEQSSEDEENTPNHAFPLPENRLTIAHAQQNLKTLFGFDSFLPKQAEIIESVLQRRSCFAILPTGGGKSLCYQLPATLFPNLTLVISPLISLMHDQILHLDQWGIPSTTLNSSLKYADYLTAIKKIKAKKISLLYVAPETLVRPETLSLLDEVGVSCVVVDEAHCVSQWGHDFRPEYRQLATIRHRWADAVWLILTATATERVRNDIITSLDLQGVKQFISNFDRPNLLLQAQFRQTGNSQLFHFLQAHRGESGIIYCATRREVDNLTTLLKNQGIRALPYHAGLNNETRHHNQSAFSRDEVEIIIATTAFGMGIDKGDIRFVVHYRLPQSLENYYQEIGRAGRDRDPATCLLLFHRSDLQLSRQFIANQAESEQKGATLRLEKMIQYAEGSGCRRKSLLAYFGEKNLPERCGHCDNCLAGVQEQRDVTLFAQQLLSCVVRTGEKFGFQHLIDVLHGSKSKKVLENQHDALSTYGIGRELSKAQWRDLGYQLLQQGYLDQDLMHGSVILTPRGKTVFKGEVVFVLANRWDQLENSKYSDEEGAFEIDYELLEQLRTIRRTIAQDAGVPAHIIFHDRSLREMCRFLPTDTAELENLYGVGQNKARRYADQFLPILIEYRRLNPEIKLPTKQLNTGEKTDRLTEIALMFNAQQQTIGEIMRQGNIKEQTVVRYLEELVKRGDTLSIEGIQREITIPLDRQIEVIAAFNEYGTDRLRPVFEALQETISYDQLRLIRLLLWSEYRLQ